MVEAIGMRVWPGHELGPGRHNLFRDPSPQPVLDARDHPGSAAIDPALAGDYSPTTRPVATATVVPGQIYDAQRPEPRHWLSSRPARDGDDYPGGRRPELHPGEVPWIVNPPTSAPLGVRRDSQGGAQRLGAAPVVDGLRGLLGDLGSDYFDDDATYQPPGQVRQCAYSRCGKSFAVGTRRGTEGKKFCSHVHGRPDRRASPRAAMPPDSYRSRQAITVGRDTPASRAISAFGTPSAASRIIRARFASPDGTLGSRASSPSFLRSPSRSARAGAKDMLHCPANHTVKQLTTRDTSRHPQRSPKLLQAA